jgi:hypothetical protein
VAVVSSSCQFACDVALDGDQLMIRLLLLFEVDDLHCIVVLYTLFTIDSDSGVMQTQPHHLCLVNMSISARSFRAFDCTLRLNMSPMCITHCFFHSIVFGIRGCWQHCPKLVGKVTYLRTNQSTNQSTCHLRSHQATKPALIHTLEMP